MDRLLQTYPLEHDIQVVEECLHTGGVVLLPTDTVFGLAALPSHPSAIARIYELKNRDVAKKLPVMVASVEHIEACGGVMNEVVERLMSSPFVPGALTMVVGLFADRRADWLAGRDECAFRIPNDTFLLTLLENIGPLCVTSANHSGQNTPDTIEDVLQQLKGRPDVVVYGNQGNVTPSTLIDCRTSPPVIERIGSIDPKQLREYLAQ